MTPTMRHEVNVFCGTCLSHIGVTGPGDRQDPDGAVMQGGRTGPTKSTKKKPADKILSCRCGLKVSCWWEPVKALWKLTTSHPVFVAGPAPKTSGTWGFGPP